MKPNTAMWLLGYTGFGIVAADYFAFLLFGCMSWLMLFGLGLIFAALPVHWLLEDKSHD